MSAEGDRRRAIVVNVFLWALVAFLVLVIWVSYGCEVATNQHGNVQVHVSSRADVYVCMAITLGVYIGILKLPDGARKALWVLAFCVAYLGMFIALGGALSSGYSFIGFAIALAVVVEIVSWIRRGDKSP